MNELFNYKLYYVIRQAKFSLIGEVRGFDGTYLTLKYSPSTPAFPKMLEVCIDSLESAINAIHGGADELEVCSSLPEGGLTPSAGLVREIMKMVDNISQNKNIYETCGSCNCLNINKRPKVNVMIRCRAGSDFCYSDEELTTMLADVEIFKAMGVERFVFGALTSTQEINKEFCSKIIASANPITVTFHRAFDVCAEYKTALNDVIELGFSRVLTSGQRQSAGDAEAVIAIKSMVEEFGNRIEIMPGAGINKNNAKTFIDMGCKIVHGSCKSVKTLAKLKQSISMGTNADEILYYTDEMIVRELKNSISKS